MCNLLNHFYRNKKNKSGLFSFIKMEEFGFNSNLREEEDGKGIIFAFLRSLVAQGVFLLTTKNAFDPIELLTV